MVKAKANPKRGSKFVIDSFLDDKRIGRWYVIETNIDPKPF